MKIRSLLVVGVGLIGGSVAMAAKRYAIARRVLGTDADPEVLKQALSSGLIDQSYDDPALAARSADMIIFCTPVDKIGDLVLAVAPHCVPGTLLTDCGST